ncbi:L-type lectin family protein [Parapedobacter koreensis]|uniref:DUF11 domain-containing protein n=1 Tax=Parapedobacter koreensis TaxID=332977 RepID=A0A1H7QND1_9SPHI|nr:hypothetical protein [Parapedobacter koreensis]SEL49429.1 hypothetical protein SAMN05421740_10622 [Parapedobacter koreensis]
MKLHISIVNSKAFYRWILLAITGMMACHTSKAQFTIIDDLRGNNYPDIVVGGPGGGGGEAYFTSGIDDPVGSGWLRLTRDLNNQRGYAYINRSFPSGMGVLVDFEYKMWRSRNDNTYNGADGLSVFLFDATTNFRLGGYGGSLGYAPNTSSNPQVTQGLAGGYIGVGFDAYGNFANPGEGRIGGPGMRPNAVVLRGPTTNNPNTTNEFLDYEPIGIRTGDDNQIRRRDEVDYNTRTDTRPSSNVFYRRVQITIMSTGTGFYDITVRWSKTPGGTFDELVTYRTTDPPPPTMKVGFAASTAGGLNFHEIRNILVTTLGNLRTVKLADRDFLIPTNAGGAGTNENKITYTIEVVNDTDAPIANIALRDTIKDAYGNILTGGPTGTFDITGFTILDPGVWIGTPSIQESTTTPNIIDGMVSIAANSTGRIQVRGTLRQTPPGNHVVNTVKLHVPEGTDQDTLNNVSSVRTPVYAEGVDLILGDIIADGRCIDYVDGNTFTVQVSNLGTDDVDIEEEEVTVTITHPPGTTLTLIDYSGWTVSHDDTTHTFLLTNPSEAVLPRGFTHPDAIRFRLTPELTDIPTRSNYTVSAAVSQWDDEESENEENNVSNASMHNCAIISNPMIYQRVKWYDE